MSGKDARTEGHEKRFLDYVREGDEKYDEGVERARSREGGRSGRIVRYERKVVERAERAEGEQVCTT